MTIYLNYPVRRPIMPTLEELRADGRRRTEVITAACELAKRWLADLPQRLSAADLESIAKVRVETEAIREFVDGPGRLAELICSELLRRCERALARGIRQGQEPGFGQWIRGSGNVSASPFTSPVDIAKVGEKSTLSAYYRLHDGVSDKAFEAAIAAAKLEFNLSRSNVIRKIKGGALPSSQRRAAIAHMAASGYNVAQIAEALGGITTAGVRRIATKYNIALPAEEVISRSHATLDSDRILTRIAQNLEGVASSLSVLDTSQVSEKTIGACAPILIGSARTISRFARHISALTDNEGTIHADSVA